MARRGAGYRIVFFLSAGMLLAALALAFLQLGDARHAIIEGALAAVSLRVALHAYAESRDTPPRARRRSSGRSSSSRSSSSHRSA